MWKFTLAVILAPVFWGLVQLPGNLVLFKLFPEVAEGSGSSSTYLILALLLAFIYAVVSGFCSAWVAGAPAEVEPRKIGLAAGLLLLAVGVAVQLGFWDALPLWWHLTFLVSIVPMTMIGARLRGLLAAR